MNQLPSQEVEARILAHVMKDLEPSWRVAHLKAALAAFAGGALSLLVCGQFGVGITEFASAFNHGLHERMGALPCALICGSLFALFPISILRLILCSSVQFKAIVRRRWSALVVWFGGFGAILALLGHHGNDALSLLGWLTATLVVTRGLAYLWGLVLAAWDPRSSLGRTSGT